MSFSIDTKKYSFDDLSQAHKPKYSKRLIKARVSEISERDSFYTEGHCTKLDKTQHQITTWKLKKLSEKLDNGQLLIQNSMNFQSVKDIRDIPEVGMEVTKHQSHCKTQCHSTNKLNGWKSEDTKEIQREQMEEDTYSTARNLNDEPQGVKSKLRQKLERFIKKKTLYDGLQLGISKPNDHSSSQTEPANYWEQQIVQETSNIEVVRSEPSSSIHNDAEIPEPFISETLASGTDWVIDVDSEEENTIDEDESVTEVEADYTAEENSDEVADILNWTMPKFHYSHTIIDKFISAVSNKMAQSKTHEVSSYFNF